MTRRPLRKRWPLVLRVSLSAVLLVSGFGVWLYYKFFAAPPPWLNRVSLTLPGLGAQIAYVATILQGLVAARELLKREAPPSPVSEDFPFRIIRDPDAVLPAMFGESPDPLADAARPYGPRRAGRDISGELRDALDTHHRVLVASVSGMGKTREIACLASRLIGEQYTVLLFDKHSRLLEPVRFPEPLSDTRNLLFVFDDLHTPCAAREGEGGRQQTFQDRLEDFLEQAVAQFGSREVSVLAAARTEQEQWAHLGWRSHPLWRGFHRYDLPTPDGEAQGCFLLEAAESGGVRMPEGDRQVIVHGNDRTYRNLLENVRQARPRGELTASTFLPHKRQTFAQAYTRLQVTHPRLVPPLWAALALLTAVGLPLLPELAVGLAARLWVGFALARPLARRRLGHLIEVLTADGDLAQAPETGELIIQEELLAAGRIPDPLAYLETLWGLLRAHPAWLPLWYRLADYAFFERGYAPLAHTICEAVVARQSNHLRALNLLGLAEGQLGQVRKSVACLERVLALARERRDREWEGIALGNLGLAYSDLGETRRAIESYEQALAIAREIGDRRMEGNALGNLGNAYFTLGETRRAIEVYEQALSVAREIGDRRMEGNALANLGLLAEGQGELAHARELWEQALRIFEAIEDPNAERVRGWLAGLEASDTDAGAG